MSTYTLTVEQLLARLAEHPQYIDAATKKLTPAQLQERPSPEEWSVNEILAHLRACADVWGGYIQKILDQDQPKIRAVSPRSYIHKTNYPELEFKPSFTAFKQQRAELLTVLSGLSPDGWERTASVKMASKVLDQSVHHFTERLITHERTHLQQIDETVEIVGRG